MDGRSLREVTSSPTDERRSRPPVDGRRSWRWLAVYLGAAGFALTQPLLGVLGENPILVTRTHVSTLDVIVVAIVTAIGIPVGLWLIDSALPTRLRVGYRAIVLTALAAAFAARLITLTAGPPAWVVIPVALLAGAFVAAMALREPLATRLLAFTAVLPAMAIALLFAGSDTGTLLRAPVVEAVELDEAIRPDDAPLPPVVMLVLDELPTMTLVDEAGELDAERFPNLATFADTATWYPEFTTTSAFTESAVPALLTGQNPIGAAPLWPDFPDNIFRLLAGSYHLSVIESNTKLCGYPACAETVRPPPPPSSTTNSGGDADPPPNPSPVAEEPASDRSRFTRTLVRLWWEGVIEPSSPGALDDFAEEVVDDTSPPDPTDSQSGTADATGPNTVPDTIEPLTEDSFNFARSIASATDGQPLRFRQWVDTIVPTDTPSLWFAHLLLPHQPFTFTATGTQFAVPIGPHRFDDPNNTNPDVIALRRRQHETQMQYTDALIGELLAQVERAGLYDDAIIVIVADHGMSFTEGTHDREFDGTNAASIAYTPLLIKFPGQESGSISAANLTSVDVLPTMADALGIELPWTSDGAAADSETVAGRDDTKPLYDYTNVFDVRLEGVVDVGVGFDAVIAGATVPDDPNDGWIGEPFAPADSSGVVAQLARVDRPDLALGVVAGTLTEPADLLVVAYDDVIVGAAPVGQYRDLDNYFAVGVDVSRFDSRDATVRIGVVAADGSITEVRVEPAS